MVLEKDSTSTPEAEQLPEKGAVIGAEKGAEKQESTEVVTQPVVRMYTEVEWDKRQSSVDKQLESSREEQKKLSAALIEQEGKAREAEYDSWLRAIDDSGGDKKAAEKAIAGLKAGNTKVQEILAREVDLNAKAALLSEAGKAKQATDLVAEHGLDPKSLAQLLDSKDSTEMELTALKLKLGKVAVDGTPASRVDPPGQGKKGDLSEVPTHTKLGQMMEDSVQK